MKQNTGLGFGLCRSFWRTSNVWSMLASLSFISTPRASKVICEDGKVRTAGLISSLLCLAESDIGIFGESLVEIT